MVAGLEHDDPLTGAGRRGGCRESCAEGKELRLIEHFAECRDGECEIAVFLHVEIHEFARRKCGTAESAEACFDFCERHRLGERPYRS